MADRFLIASLPNGGRVVACISPSVRFTQARLDDSKLSASLSPYADETAARAALEAVGATITGDLK